MQTISKKYKVDRSSINYIRWIIESYDGMAIVTTINPHKAIIELKIAPGCETLIDELIYSLKTAEGLNFADIINR